MTDPAPPGGATVRIRGLEHEYGRGARRLPVLRGVDLDIEAGDHIALTGPSGAGKSTLLSLVGGLERPQRGELRVDGQELSRLRGDALSGYRRRTVGFVFQHFGLVQVLTARENLELALSLSGVPRRARAARADTLLDQIGLGDRADHRPTQLSGGEQQRVAIARALAHRPRLLLADEPTGNLDEDASARVLELLDRLRAESGCTLVVVTHNPAVAARAPRRARLAAGLVRASGGGLSSASPSSADDGLGEPPHRARERPDR
ncbi:MAG TPA: ABC transporter ATP-binding protein [Candidatus Dormibacteraeota bacterium]|nr:ABC transporter ATP-binding protein [Candidatus Dormibacteraeota bacterium]